MKHFKMNYVDWTALALIVVGAVNWGLVGVGHFVDAAANWSLVHLLLGSVPALEFAVYLLVGLAGIYGIYFATRIAGVETPEPEPASRERVTPK
ncbi:MAG: DUF378 domain-containing protein [Haloarculaceae archaeon]